MSKVNQTTWVVALSTTNSGVANDSAPEPTALPTAPGLVTITNPEGGELINFTAGTDGDSPITGYVATILPAGPTLTIVSPDPSVGGSVEVSNFTYDLDYVVGVSAVNDVGEGDAAYTNSFQIESVYNSATGGVETIVNDFEGTGEKWVQHTFTVSGKFALSSDTQPIKVRLIGKGGSSGYADCPMSGGGAGGGAGGYEWNDYLAVGDYAVTIGTGNSKANGNGGSTTVEGVGTCGGGGNGVREAYNSDVGYGAAGTWGGSSSGAMGGTDQYKSAPFVNLWDGQAQQWGRGANLRVPSDCGVNYPTQNGVVAIAYQIGMSSAEEIANAAALRKAQLRKSQIEEKARMKKEAKAAKLRK